MKIRLVLTSLLVAFCGCASSPDLDYFNVEMTSSGTVGVDVHLVVERFSPTERLDRHQIVIQQTPTRVEYYATARWATSVGEMVQGKLQAEFGFPRSDDRPTFVVSGRVLAFEQVDAGSSAQGRVVLEVAIRAAGQQRYETPLLTRTYEATRPLDEASADGAVRALSRALEDIAADIAEDVPAVKP
jgi:uncharacterized lipoprotein YmbA